MDSSDWYPIASDEMLRLRAQLLTDVRAFFRHRNVLEVDTPILSHAGNPDIYIESFRTHYDKGAIEQSLYLQTSPEFAMKRLLAAGCGSIYQICKAFRKGELGRLHNPEFTILEWYRTGFDHHQLMQEIMDLLIFTGLLGEGETIKKISFQALFEKYTGLNPHTADQNTLARFINDSDISVHSSDVFEKDDLLNLILTHVIEPAIHDETFLLVYDYPASQASLAKIRQDEFPVAERFELYSRGVELANGFHELTDAQEQLQRFQGDQLKRLSKGLEKVEYDQKLIDALSAGMESCSGVAIGFDRLLMIAANKLELREVLAFPFNKA